MLSLYLALIDDPSDKELFEKIYTEYEKQMLYVANEVLNDEHLAEDACQIAFTRIATHIKKLRVLDENKTKCYLFISAKNAALDIVKKRQREKTVDIDAFYNLYDKKAHDEIEHISDESYILEILNKLPDTYTDVMYLHFVVGMSENDVAQLLNRKINTIRQQVSRGRKKFIELYEKEQNN